MRSTRNLTRQPSVLRLRGRAASFPSFPFLFLGQPARAARTCVTALFLLPALGALRNSVAASCPGGACTRRPCAQGQPRQALSGTAHLPPGAAAQADDRAGSLLARGAAAHGGWGARGGGMRARVAIATASSHTPRKQIHIHVSPLSVCCLPRSSHTCPRPAA